MHPSDASPYIAVLGSLNLDLVLRTPRVPQAGETLSGHSFATYPGGKGANQAVACARLGARVRMIGRIGSDSQGQQLLCSLQADGVDCAQVSLDASQSSGVAMILVEDSGQNRILLAAGANATLTTAQVDAAASTVRGAALLVCQLETPLDSVRHAMEIAHTAGVPVLLNPAPAQTLPPQLLSKLSYLVPNETEASLLCGMPVCDVPSAMRAALQLRALGTAIVLITLGAHGVVLADDNGCQHFPAQAVHAVDSTAAGDTFIGGLAAGLVSGMHLIQAIAQGQAAAALCVTRQGAQSSIPFLRELGPRLTLR